MDDIEELSELDEFKSTLSQQAPLPLSGQFRGVDRPDSLIGITYKLKQVPNGNDALVNVYLVINELDGRPFEIFVNSSDARISGRTNALTLMISRQLRNDIPVHEIVGDLLKVIDKDTGHYIPNSQGFYAPSLEARIGYTLRQHIDKQGINGLMPLLLSQPIRLKGDS